MYDVIIIGGGPAGLSAGIYSCRAGLKTLMIEKMMPGGQAATTAHIDNYPGFEEGIGGMELTSKMEAQAVKFGMEIAYDEVNALDLKSDPKVIKTTENEYQAKAVILAMGGKHRLLNVEGESRLMGRGVSYCATCDGAFFKNKEVAVIGGGNAAVEDALDLVRYASKVYLIHRREEMRAEKVLQEELMKDERIVKVFNSVVERINGENEVEYLEIKNVKTNGMSTIKVKGVFVAIGQEPDNTIIKGIVDTDDYGFIKTDESMKTSVSGVFAAGDIRSKPLRQVITAAADGAIAAISAGAYIK